MKRSTWFALGRSAFWAVVLVVYAWLGFRMVLIALALNEPGVAGGAFFVGAFYGGVFVKLYGILARSLNNTVALIEGERPAAARGGGVKGMYE